MKKIFLLVIALLFFVGCATFPPPKIQDGRYINPKYGFSIEVPKGWYQTEKIPEWIKDILDEEKRATIRIMFFNNDTNGFITISTYKTIWSFSLLYCAYDKIYDNMEKQLEKKKQKLIKDPYIKSFSYTFNNIEHWSESLYCETEFQKLEGRSENFMYGCCGDDTCIVTIALISDIKTFDNNYNVFKITVDSFQGWLL